ncbi:MAG: hypothetical protein JNJ85_12775 [Candidatus Kapabacteria bacterium]|nr:hypothetical protein [Candidatus Kapabacteria bacterium]
MQNTQQTLLGKYAPLLIASVLAALCIVYYHVRITHANNGMFVYTIDDPYIHASMARNLAQHGTWGISPNAISSASSSPMWVLLLSVIYLVTDSQLIPYAVNIVLAFVLLFVVHRYFLQHGLTPIARTLGLVLLWFATPLPGLIFTGMEHILHIILTVLLLHTAVTTIATNNFSRNSIIHLVILCLLNSAIRPEGILLSGIVAGVVLLSRRWSTSILLLLASVAPMVIFGLWSITHDELFFPNSVIVKSLDNMHAQQNISGLRALFPRLGAAITLLRRYEEVLWCLQLTTVIFSISLWKQFQLTRTIHFKTFLSNAQVLTFGFVLSSVLAHITVSDAGWFFRYEAYLIALCIISGFTFVVQWLSTIKLPIKPVVAYSIASALCIILCFPIASRSLQAARQLVPYSQMVYQKQIQTARFLSTYYNNKPVGVTDIGAVSYFTTAQLTDFYGLGSAVVARHKKNHTWSAEVVKHMAIQQQWQCAFTYEELQREFIPTSWLPVATLTIDAGLFADQSTLTFYAPQPQYEQQLRNNLQAFSATVPHGVTITLK